MILRKRNDVMFLASVQISRIRVLASFFSLKKQEKGLYTDGVSQHYPFTFKLLQLAFRMIL